MSSTPAPTEPEAGPSGRPLRADAERNRELILEAAARAFADRGLGVRLDEIAEEAGVGVGTVYRRFKDKQALVEALFRQEVGRVVALADEALAEHGDGTGLRWFLEHVLQQMACDRALLQLLTGQPEGVGELKRRVAEEMAPRVGTLVEQARAAGRVRPDMVAADMPILQVMLSTVMDATRVASPDLWQRYVTLVLDALEPYPGAPLLPGPAPTIQQGSAVVDHWRPPARRPGARS